MTYLCMPYILYLVYLMSVYDMSVCDMMMMMMMAEGGITKLCVCMLYILYISYTNLGSGRREGGRESSCKRREDE